MAKVTKKPSAIVAQVKKLFPGLGKSLLSTGLSK